MPTQILLGRQEAADAVGLSIDEIKKALGAGELRAKKRGRRVLIPVGELQRWADELPDF